jgi:ribosomal protein L37E
MPCASNELSLLHRSDVAMARRRNRRAAAKLALPPTRNLNTSWRCSAQNRKQPRSSFTATWQYTPLRAQTVFGGTSARTRSEKRARSLACRHCSGLAYETQQQSARWRGFAKAQKIRMRLDGSVDLLEPFPEKPRRMHWRTYNQLHHAYRKARDRCIQGILGPGVRAA